MLSKINRCIFNMTELITLLFLSYFSNNLNSGFCIAYALLLIILFYIKLKFTTCETEISGELTAAVLLCEYSAIFLRYAELSLKLYMIQALIIIILISALFSIALIKETSFDVQSLTKTVLVLGSILLFISIIANKNTWAIELTKLIFVCTIILFSKRTDSQIPILISAVLSCAVLAIFIREFGTAMVIALSTLIMTAVNNRSPKLTATILILSTVTLSVWFFIYHYDSLYHALYNNAPSFSKPALERLFFDYDPESDQIVLINNVIDCRGFKSEFFLLIKPTNFVNLIPNSISETTGVTDYMFSLMLFFNGKLLSAIVILISSVSYISAIAVKRCKSNLIVPIILLTQSLVHICGNRLIFPFTGVPLIFVSYAPAAILCSLTMIIISAVNDKEE